MLEIDYNRIIETEWKYKKCNRAAQLGGIKRKRDCDGYGQHILTIEHTYASIGISIASLV